MERDGSFFLMQMFTMEIGRTEKCMETVFTNQVGLKYKENGNMAILFLTQQTFEALNT